MKERTIEEIEKNIIELQKELEKKKRKETKGKVITAEAEEVQEEDPSPTKPVQTAPPQENQESAQTSAPETSPEECVIRIGYKKDGTPIFEVYGNNVNLMMLDGILKYAQRELDNVWKSRFDARLAAPAESKEG